ncbi:MAG: ankyrin repeat domain-containing protein [Gammaproteobacteria bacterium]|nr:ankyrin repeat domain-containing protein [Gammaproteobacteria bacterium]
MISHQIECAECEFYYAASQDDVQYARIILERFSDPSAKKNIINSKHVLHAAVTHGSEAFVRFLIDEGVELNELDKSLSPRSALNLAVLYCREYIALMLIEAGADITIDPQEQMLNHALARGLESVAVALLAKGARIHCEGSLYIALRLQLIDAIVALRLACHDRLFDESFRMKLVNMKKHPLRIRQLLAMSMTQLKASPEAEWLINEYPALLHLSGGTHASHSDSDEDAIWAEAFEGHGFFSLSASSEEEPDEVKLEETWVMVQSA